MADVTVASTTDELSDVRLAAGLPAKEELEIEKPETEIEEELTEEIEAESEEGKVEPEVESEEGDDEKPEARQKPRSGWQKRVDKLTARNYALEEELESRRAEQRKLEDRLSKLETGAGKGDSQVVPTADQFSKPKPVSKDFDDYDKFAEALADWKMEEKEFKAVQVKAAEAQTRQNARLEETFKAYNKAVSTARAEYEDFDEVVGREDLLLPMAVQTAIVGMRENGPAVSYAIAQDEQICNKLCEIAQEDGDVAALTEFGRWLAINSEEEPAPVRKTVAAKPRPIKPVGGSSTKSSVAIDDMEYRDYRRLRDEQERARHRG